MSATFLLARVAPANPNARSDSAWAPLFCVSSVNHQVGGTSQFPHLGVPSGSSGWFTARQVAERARTFAEQVATRWTDRVGVREITEASDDASTQRGLGE